jgi:pilus assembly protein Flp/PilA
MEYALLIGLDCIGCDCLNADPWDDDQQRVLQHRSEPDLASSNRRPDALFSAPAIREEPTMNTTLKRLWKGEEGQDLTEYALLMVLIALVAVASMQTIGTTISNVFSNAAVNLSPS